MSVRRVLSALVLVLVAAVGARAQQRTDDQFQALFQQGYGQLQNREYDAAIETFKKAIQIDPNLAPAYCRLGQLYYRRANLKEAEQALQTAIEIDPELSGAQECVASLPATPKGSP